MCLYVYTSKHACTYVPRCTCVRVSICVRREVCSTVCTYVDTIFTVLAANVSQKSYKIFYGLKCLVVDHVGCMVHVTSYLFFSPKSVVCHHGIPCMFANISAERPYPLCRLATGTYQLRNTFLGLWLSCLAGETIFTRRVKVALR